MQLIGQFSDKFENDCFTSGIFIDPSKAFDTVIHQVLITREGKRQKVQGS